MASRTSATRSMSRRSALSTFPMIKTPSRFFGEQRKRSLPLPPVSTSRGLRRDQQSREWVEANRRAIELFQKGAEQSDAANPGGDSVVDGQRLALLVLLEGEKRLASGDTAGAWDCNRASPPHGHSHQTAGELASASRP